MEDDHANLRHNADVAEGDKPSEKNVSPKLTYDEEYMKLMKSPCRPEIDGYFGSIFGGDIDSSTSLALQFGISIETLPSSADINAIKDAIEDYIVDLILSTTFPYMCGFDSSSSSSSNGNNDNNNNDNNDRHYHHKWRKLESTMHHIISGFWFGPLQEVDDVSCTPTLDEKNYCGVYQTTIGVFGKLTSSELSATSSAGTSAVISTKIEQDSIELLNMLTHNINNDRPELIHKELLHMDSIVELQQLRTTDGVDLLISSQRMNNRNGDGTYNNGVDTKSNVNRIKWSGVGLAVLTVGAGFLWLYLDRQRKHRLGRMRRLQSSSSRRRSSASSRSSSSSSTSTTSRRQLLLQQSPAAAVSTSLLLANSRASRSNSSSSSRGSRNSSSRDTPARRNNGGGVGGISAAYAYSNRTKSNDSDCYTTNTTITTKSVPLHRILEEDLEEAKIEEDDGDEYESLVVEKEEALSPNDDDEFVDELMDTSTAATGSYITSSLQSHRRQLLDHIRSTSESFRSEYHHRHHKHHHQQQQQYRDQYGRSFSVASYSAGGGGGGGADVVGGVSIGGSMTYSTATSRSSRSRNTVTTTNTTSRRQYEQQQQYNQKRLDPPEQQQGQQQQQQLQQKLYPFDYTNDCDSQTTGEPPSLMASTKNSSVGGGGHSSYAGRFSTSYSMEMVSSIDGNNRNQQQYSRC